MIKKIEDNCFFRIAVQLVIIAMSAVSIASVVKGYLNFSASVGEIDLVTDNWKTQPFVDFQIVKGFEDCPTGYTAETTVYFPGMSGACAVRLKFVFNDK